MLICSLIILLSACNATKHLQSDEYLYEETEVEVISVLNKNNKNLERELAALSVMKPNTNLNSWLWIYNKTKNAEKGLGKWMNERLGEAPSIYDASTIERSVERMKTHMFNEGYFQNTIETTATLKKQKAAVKYTVSIKQQYLFGEITFPDRNSGVERIIKFYNNQSLLNTGKPFSVDLLKAERERIKKLARNSGYFRFVNDYVSFELDSTTNKGLVDVFINVNYPDSSGVHQKSYVRDIKIYTDYNPNVNADRTGLDSVEIKDVNYVYKNDIVKPEVILRSLAFEKGQPYSLDNYNRTVNNLINLGIYKYVTLQINPYKQDNFDSLNAVIILTSKDKLEFEVDLELNSKSDIFSVSATEGDNSFNLGSAISLTHSNLNSFGGAERLTMSLFSGVEYEVGKPDSLINAIDISGQINLLIPKFVLPFKLDDKGRRYIPKTEISLGVNYLNRRRYYSLASFNGNFGYQWRSTLRRQHRLYPISINYLRLINTTADFDDILNSNPNLLKSFEEQLVIGSRYTFIFNSIIDRNHKNYYYFKASAEWAGNVANGILDIDGETSMQNTLLGVKTSQFVKVEGQWKYYRLISDDRTFASRIIGGIGVPYGNSEVLPYSRQFFIGGTNSVRAFNIRTLGPGTYVPEVNEDNLFIDQTGEIKLEANIEYRLKLASVFNLAVFADAGNIWTLKEDIDRLGSQFKFDSFYKQIALGTGFGVRLDFSYFVIRLDAAIPLRKPVITNEKFQWVVNEIDFYNKTWREDNLVLNLAIGYPF